MSKEEFIISVSKEIIMELIRTNQIVMAEIDGAPNIPTFDKTFTGIVATIKKNYDAIVS